MPMNRFHQWCCRSDLWGRRVRDRLIPWALDGVELAGRTLEIGPGYGATTRVLAPRTESLTALEVDAELATMLRRDIGAVEVVHGDGTQIPFDDGSFTTAVCFTMLHHLPSPESQDQLFSEVRRVLRPGGVFAGSDSLPSLKFRLIHLFDTMVVIDPDRLGTRLEAAGFGDVRVQAVPGAFRFVARRW